jgi:glycosyltransferase involved in cell wall biosynthesis
MDCLALGLMKTRQSRTWRATAEQEAAARDATAASRQKVRDPTFHPSVASNTKLRLLLVRSHVVQYSAPVLRRLARDTRLEILVAFCSMQGAQAGIDPGFGMEFSWDTPLLEGYPWVLVRNWAPRPGLGRFFGFVNPGLWSLIRSGQFDAVLVSGYFYASAWIAILAAKWCGVPILFSTEAHSLQSWATRSKWRLFFKKCYLRRVLALGRILLTMSSGSAQQLRALGFADDRIILSPYSVYNDWWSEQAAKVDRDGVRKSWQIPIAGSIVLFCGKLQPWKAPQDLLDAFVRANVPNSYLVFAGDGPLRGDIERRAREVGISERMRMLGFVNQSQLPSVYRAADLLVLPSLYEPFGLVVNEAMLCGLPVAISDRVGAKFDLVRPGENGYVFPAEDVRALASIITEFLSDPEKQVQLRLAARRRMETWSPREYVEAVVKAVWQAVYSEQLGPRQECI